MQSLDLLDFVLLSTEAVPFLTGLVLFPRLLSELRQLVPLFGFALCANWLIASMQFEGINAAPLLHLVTPVEFCILMLVFASWQKSVIWQKVLLYSIPLFFIVVFLLKLYVETINEYDSYSSSLEALLLIFVAVKLLLDLNRNLPSTSLLHSPQFWIASSVLLYFTGNLLFFVAVLMDIQIEHSIHEIINPLANLGYTGGFLCCFSHRPEKSTS